MALGTAQAGNSQLWGASGELWDPLGRLPDFSYAGYGQGESTIPNVPVEHNVTKFGAVGDGIADDTAAFQAAIDGTSHGAVLIPPGTYRIEGQLKITKSMSEKKITKRSKVRSSPAAAEEERERKRQQEWQQEPESADIPPPSPPLAAVQQQQLLPSATATKSPEQKTCGRCRRRCCCCC